MAKVSKNKSSSDTQLTNEDILHLANLVRLTLSKEEVEDLKGQLGDTISYIKNLGELDTSSVDTSTKNIRTKNVSFSDGAQNDRTLSQSDAVKNAPSTKNGYFVVPKILDK